jgi:hypothetical protein
VARLAIAKGFLAEYARLDKSVQSAVESAIAKFAEHTHAGLHLEKLQHSRDQRIRTIRVDSFWRGVVLAPEKGDTYCLITVMPHDKANAYAASHRFSVNQALGVLEVRDEEAIQHLQPSLQAVTRTPGEVVFVSSQEELQHILAHPFAAWRTFLHPTQRKIAYKVSYAGPAQVTGGAGTGKTVTALHRAAFLAARVHTPAGASGPDQVAAPILLTTCTRNLAEALEAQLALLIDDPTVRSRIDVLNVDRLAYGIVKRTRGARGVADNREVRARWTRAAADSAPSFTPVFLNHEWEQVILAQDLRTEQAYLTCLRTGRGRPLTKAQRSQVWQTAERVTAELAAARQSTHLQLANEAARLLRRAAVTRYQHVIVDEAQDLHPAQWRLLRAVVPPGANDLFIVSDPHQRIYDNHVSLTSLGIGVRGHEFATLAERIRGWLATGIEAHAIGVAARSTRVAREARDALRAAGIESVPLSSHGSRHSVRVGTMHGMKGLEFQAVAVIGAEQGLVPAPTAVTPASDDAVKHAQDLQRDRCLLFVACTRARDHLYVSCTGEPSPFLPK